MGRGFCESHGKLVFGFACSVGKSVGEPGGTEKKKEASRRVKIEFWDMRVKITV